MSSPVVKLSLRLRLTIWYSAIVALTLSAFGVLTYTTVSKSLHKNLDASLERVSNSLEFIIQKKQQETNKPLSSPYKRKKRRNTSDLAFLSEQYNAATPQDTTMVADSAAEEPDVVWSAVYEHILMNSKNFYIQIADTNNVIYWRSVNSRNLSDKLLPFYNTIVEKEGSKVFSYDSINGQKLRIYATRSAEAQITVGYTLTEIEDTLSDLFGLLKLVLPLALLLAIVGGYFLARYSLRQVDVITHSAQEITAHNLSKRLPMPAVNDEIARLTATLNEMIERLEASFAQIRQFTSDASHELRTPLAILMGELELILRRERSKDEYVEAISSSLEEVIRLSQVVNNLLEISRAESGQATMKFDLVNISKIAEDVCEDLEIIADEKHITLTSDIQEFVTLRGDSIRLHQVFLNIIDNAIKYTPDNGEVHVKVALENMKAVIVVTDTGIGIHEEDIPKIFDRFFRVDPSRSQDVQGNGLGLSIVRWIVEAHNGTITVSSTFGQGTTFTIILPLDQIHQKIS